MVLIHPSFWFFSLAMACGAWTLWQSTRSKRSEPRRQIRHAIGDGRRGYGNGNGKVLSLSPKVWIIIRCRMSPRCGLNCCQPLETSVSAQSRLNNPHQSTPVSTVWGKDKNIGRTFCKKLLMERPFQKTEMKR